MVNTMSTPEYGWKQRIQRILNNGYLSFGAGLMVGLFIDNWTLVLVVALVILGVQWYSKQKGEDVTEPAG